MLKRLLTSAIAIASINAALANDELMPPTLDSDLHYQYTLLEGTYTSEVSRPDSLLGHRIGEAQIATPLEIEALFKRWAEESDRMVLKQYATSHEGRPLFVAYISSPDNLARLDEIKSNIHRLAHPSELSSDEVDDLIDQLPATAWMAYSIHGNETSGADSAVAAAYHLVADQSSETSAMLDDMIVMIDPMMNPDGRARFAKTLEQFRGTAPNVDDQSLLHSGDWPFGRMNHYLFDLNRDFFYLTQPETRGRVALINDWYPQLMIDGHEMGAQDTFLMGPPREPINTHVPQKVKDWSDFFAEEQAAAFDARGWRYYTGEWFENLYTGYSNYSEYRGSIHILYEQSRMAEDGVRRPEGTVQTYEESVHHQYVSTLANLQTLAKHSDAIYRDFVDARLEALDTDGPYADRSYVILPTENKSRLEQFAEKLLAQDIEVYIAEDDIEVDLATRQSGIELEDYDIPAGALVIPNRQPEGRLVSAILEFDATISDEVLRKERSAILRGEPSLMYDTTAWNLTMMYGLDALVVDEEIDSDLIPYSPSTYTPLESLPDGIAWVVDGADDLSLAYAARLMERGLELRASDEVSAFGTNRFNPGSIMVTVTDNPNLDVRPFIIETANELGLNITTINTGFGQGDMPEWGGRHFPLLERPQIAMLSHSPTNPYALGSTWFAIDSVLGIRHSQINIQNAAYTDLRRYNVIIVPPAWGQGLNSATVSALEDFMRNGGTVISLGGASEVFAQQSFTQTDVLNSEISDISVFDMAVYQELMADNHRYELEAMKSHTLPTHIEAPWGRALNYGSVDDLLKRDLWLQKFMPRGSFVTGRVDDDHWLSFGAIEEMPLLYTDTAMLMPSGRAEAVIRAGQYRALEGSLSSALNGEWEAIGWTSVPKEAEVQLRMSGMLWPEASQRILNTAYIVREPIGRGQLIMFANEANFRGAALGSRRLLLNAIVLGPGMGTNLKIDL